ncbi:MAG: EAL domain-containing protein, partial [Deltaproteobacteria bacterium]
MKRQRIISVTVLLVLLCATLPVSLSYYLAWRLALTREESKLAQLAALSIRRTDTAFDEAHGALLSMGASQLQPCSQSHLAQMRALVLASHYIVELGYI